MNRFFSTLILFVALTAAPSAHALQLVENKLVEKNPRADLAAYLLAGEVPTYLRINVAGYNIRTTPDFASAKTDNIDFTVNHGTKFAIKKVDPKDVDKVIVPLENGVAVNIVVDGADRWVYVPNARKRDFQFCGSEACMSDLAIALKFFQDQNIGPEQLAACGYTLSDEGKLIDLTRPKTVAEALAAAQRDANAGASDSAPLEAPALSADTPIALKSSPFVPSAHQPQAFPDGAHAPIPRVRPRREAAEAAARQEAPAAAPEAGTLLGPVRPRRGPSVQLAWERARPVDGKQWTSLLSQALDKFGQGMINRRTMVDKQNWCPNFDRLRPGQRKEFWAHLLNGVARYESGFKTNLTFDERSVKNKRLPANPRSGKIRPDVYSQGLFQLSYDSAGQDAYGRFCKFDLRRDRNKDISNSSLTIYDVKKQIDCAVGILNHNVMRDGGIAYDGDPRPGKKNISHRGGARFWSTLRANSAKTKLVRETLKRYTPCGLK